ncbi:MAG: zf-HC2 domain-containing protein [Acidobacteria bacterium]|nr:zf-HC2 domain-containing protein [Acidobacteriota bacterium]MCB9398318.1 zf-HC2 domain-containing protein [Acidobacteriota bacterium]
MKHLNEEQLIDLLFDSADDEQPELRAHLAECEPCRGRFTLIQSGLTFAQAGKMEVPQNITPIGLNYRSMARKTWTNRFLLAAAAVFIVFSILGFRVDYNREGFSMSFSVLGAVPKTQNEQVEVLQEQLVAMEKRLFDAMAVQNQMAYAQLSDRLENYEYERAVELSEFSRQIESNLHQVDRDNEIMMASYRTQIGKMLETQKVKGRIQ